MNEAADQRGAAVVLTGEQLRDEHRAALVRTTRTAFAGRVWTVRTDEIRLDGGGVVVRDWVDHPGAVAVVAVDEKDRMLLVRQYRHPVGSLLWEAPAGLCDVPGESRVATAVRELAEETGYQAARWDTLVDVYLSPGGSSEAVRIFLARRPSPAPATAWGRPEGEEVGMPVAWVDLDRVVAQVRAGRLHSPTLADGALAAQAARVVGWTGLRPADAGWDLG
ncbi:MAG: NUDIX domain-containing protein [Actinomycetes bacterium]